MNPHVKKQLVVGLDLACQIVDTVMYRPFVVKLTERLPVHWRCQLGSASVHLDRRWDTGHWDGMEPTELCDACGLRAAWLEVGGIYPGLEDDPEDDFMSSHPVQLCGYCHVDGPIENARDLEAALARAKAETVRWKL